MSLVMVSRLFPLCHVYVHLPLDSHGGYTIQEKIGLKLRIPLSAVEHPLLILKVPFNVRCTM